MVELLLSLALAAALFFGVSTVLQTQVAVVRRLKMKMELTSFYLDLQRSLSVPANCLKNFAPPFSIDEYRLHIPGYGVNLNSLVEDGSPPIRLLTAGQKVDNLTYDATVAGIRAINVTKIGPDSFLLDVFAPIRGTDGKVVQHFNLTRVHLKTDPDSKPAQKIPIACRYGGDGVDTTDCRIVSENGSLNFPHFLMCGPDETMIAGGGACLGRSKDEVGFISHSGPKLTANQSGWEFDCRGKSAADDLIPSQVVVYCCKK